MMLLLLMVVNVVICEPISVTQGLLNQLGIKIHKKGEVRTIVSVVESSTVKLPCNISTGEDDSVRLVLWFKGKDKTPIYTFDTRGGLSVKDARHYSDDKIFKGRAYFRGGGKIGRLVIEGVESSDQGVYRCRVDFSVAPTRTSEVELEIITPPEKPIVYDEDNSIIRTKLGPYREGENVNLRCEVLGGNPAPTVTWWREHTLLDTKQIVFKHKVVNHLKIAGVSRADLDSLYSCQASNNNQSAPVSTSVKLDLTYGPEMVKITGMKQAVSAGEQYRINCTARGSRPSPTISWFQGVQNLDNLVDNVETSPDGTETTSTLEYTPTIQDDGSVLRCRAAVDSLLGSAVETSWNVIVHYKPALVLEYGRSIEPNSIKEGEDVYFECMVNGNPLPTKITWRKNGFEFEQDIKKGVIMSNMTLVLQKVDRSSSGTYTCHANNIQGSGYSNGVALDVLHPPECAPGQVQLYAVQKHKSIKVRCEVTSKPDSPITFRWKFNNTREVVDIQESQFTNEKGVSELLYTPRTDFDYGTLLCSAENEVGVQNTPCPFLIIPSQSPDPVHNCTVQHRTHSRLSVKCIPGFGGGMDQYFYAEVMNNASLMSNISSPSPDFLIQGLESETEYNVTVYSANSRGRSNLTLVTTQTIPSIIKPSDNTDQAKLGSLRTRFTITPVLGVLIGVGSALVIVSIIILFIVCCRSKYTKVSESCHAGNECEGWGMKGDGSENCPDLIPRCGEEYKQIQINNKVKSCGLSADLDALHNIHHNISILGNESTIIKQQHWSDNLHHGQLVPSPTCDIYAQSHQSFMTSSSATSSASSSKDESESPRDLDNLLVPLVHPFNHNVISVSQHVSEGTNNCERSSLLLQRQNILRLDRETKL